MVFLKIIAKLEKYELESAMNSIWHNIADFFYLLLTKFDYNFFCFAKS